MKKHLSLLFLICFLGILSYSQTPDFWFHHPYPSEWSFTGTSVLELASANTEASPACLLAVCDIARDFFTYEPESTYPAKILKISEEGELMDELTLGEEGCRSVIYKLWLDPTNPKYCLAVGKTHDNALHYDKPFLAKFDHDLNLQWQRTIDLPEEYRRFFYQARVMMDSQGDIVFCTAPYEGVIPLPTFYVHRLFIRLSSEGELLALSSWPETSDLLEGGQGALFEYTDGSGDYGQFVNSFLVRMNRDFEFLNQQEFPITIYIPNGYMSLFYMSNSYVIPKSDGTFIIGCRADETVLSPSLDVEEGTVMLVKWDADSIVNMSFSGFNNDSVDMICSNQGMANHGENEIYFCNNQCDNYSYSQLILGINSFVVTKTDGEANILWQRFIRDGVHYFQAVAVETANNGDCLVMGDYGTYDNGKTREDTNVFLIKICADGSLNVSEWESLLKPYSFWPNPVQDRLNLKYSPDVQPQAIELYDLQGRLVRTQTTSLESLSMEGLAAGQYVMKVTMEDGKVFTDKVVKE